MDGYLKPIDVTLPDNLGNEFALVQLELPTDEPDALRVLAAATRRMNRIKHGHEAAVAFRLQEVEGIVGWAPVSGNQPMSFGIFTYNGDVTVGIACDKTLVPDHEAIVDGFADAFGRLLAATPGVTA